MLEESLAISRIRIPTVPHYPRGSSLTAINTLQNMNPLLGNPFWGPVISPGNFRRTTWEKIVWSLLFSISHCRNPVLQLWQHLTSTIEKEDL